MDRLVEQQTDAVPRLQPLVEQEPRGLVGPIVELAECERHILGDDSQVIRGQLIAALLEVLFKSLARLPANRIVGVLADQHVTLPASSGWRRRKRHCGSGPTSGRKPG